MFKEIFKKKMLIYIIICLSLLFTLRPQITLSQEYPTRPITIVVPQPSGSASDLIFRAVTSVAVDYLGQPIVIQLKPGANGAIGADFVAKSPADGYTLLAGGMGWNTALPAIEGRSKGPDSFIGVCRLKTDTGFVVTRPGLPFKTWKEMMVRVRENPGKLTVGNPGILSPPDMAWKVIVRETGINIRIVRFEGAGSEFLSILGGHIDVGHARPIMYYPYKGTGKLLPLLTTGCQRHPDFPDIPTPLEEGLSELVCKVALVWGGVMAPKGTPRPIIDKLAMAFKKMTEDKTVKDMMTKFGESFDYLNTDDFNKFWREEFELFKELGKTFKN